MAPSVRSLLVGRPDAPLDGRLALVAPVVVGFATFAAYATGVFEIQGGVVFVPGEAAVLGVGVALLLSALGAGVGAAWLTVYGALLGYSADHYLLGLSYRPWAGRIEAFLGPDGLAFLGIEALVLGTLAWVGGRLAGRLLSGLQGRRTNAYLG